MIVNLWSTPRTGSVWYSKHLQTLHPASTLLTEPFNRYHLNMYYLVENGLLRNYQYYINGAFYKEYQLDDNGFITWKKNYAPRVRNVDEEENHIFSLIKNCNKSQTIIMHNHVSPLSEIVRTYLLANSIDNIYIYRKDKRAQLGSYAIAYQTKQFAIFGENQKINSFIIEIDIPSLTNLIKRIEVWDKIKEKNQIAYEDIVFYNRDKFPIKQNLDYKQRLSSNCIKIIDELVTQYEKNNNL